ncbi:MAG: hypothetical protein IJN39_03290 [Clostridia bacterium]|nr:hypothetical protein [Clostridia bacterium]
MRRFFIAVTVQQDRNDSIFTPKQEAEPNPGYYAYIIPVTESDNIKSVLERVGGLLHANIYHTKKKAAEVVQMWNDGYKNNGTYLFDSTF